MTTTNHLTSPVYRQNYQRLEDLLGQPLPDLRPETVYRLRAEGFMDLVVEVLPRDPDTGAMVLSLAHYFELNGDLCQDPEMVVRVFPPRGDHPGRLEALTFQQAIPPIYSVVYPEPGKVVPRLKRELNAFLATWLRNLKAQGHRLASSTDCYRRSETAGFWRSGCGGWLWRAAEPSKSAWYLAAT